MKQVIQAHGANRGAYCAKCGKDADVLLLKEHIRNGQVLKCLVCQAPCKPAIVFFGESLPQEFHEAVKKNLLKETDLLIVIGTALAVAPFNQIPYRISNLVPKVLINMENTHKTGN